MVASASEQPPVSRSNHPDPGRGRGNLGDTAIAHRNPRPLRGRTWSLAAIRRLRVYARNAPATVRHPFRVIFLDTHFRALYLAAGAAAGTPKTQDLLPTRHMTCDPLPEMARRISALLGIVAIVGLALVLMWRVYLHHERAFHPEEPTLVSLFGRAAQ